VYINQTQCLSPGDFGHLIQAGLARSWYLLGDGLVSVSAKELTAGCIAFPIKLHCIISKSRGFCFSVMLKRDLLQSLITAKVTYDTGRSALPGALRLTFMAAAEAKEIEKLPIS
jgi:hypothetical protein